VLRSSGNSNKTKEQTGPTGEDASRELQCSKVSTRVVRNTGLIKPKNICVNRFDILHVNRSTNNILSPLFSFLYLAIVCSLFY